MGDSVPYRDRTLMRVAVIGSGSVGSGLARAWSAVGHSVIIGSRSPDSERVIALVSGIGNAVEAAWDLTEVERAVLAETR